MNEQALLLDKLPFPARVYCEGLLAQYKFKIHLSKRRSTKLGHFKYHRSGEVPTISLNYDMNAYAFLITFLHELAHLIVFEEYGRKVLPHGKEWKDAFRSVAQPVCNEQVFPVDVLIPLLNYFKNPKAATTSDPKLTVALRKYDFANHGKQLLAEINDGESFQFKKKQYRRIKLKRRWVECIDIESNRKYLISSIAEVKKIAG